MSTFNLNKKECEAVGGYFFEGYPHGSCQTNRNNFKGKFQSMNWGSLVKNPNFLIRMEKPTLPGESLTKDDFFGTLKAPDEDNLDRVISMTKHLGISGTDEIIRKQKPNVDVLFIEDNFINKKKFTPIIKHKWKEVGV